MNKDQLAYLTRRLLEAPFKLVLRKILEKLKKNAFIVYYLGVRYFRGFRRRVPDNTHLSNLTEFGDTLKSGVLSAKKNTKWRDTACKRARNFLENGFPVLGYGHIRVQKGVDWHRDYFHNFSWPVQYFTRIDFVAANEFCDVKVPWELSRLQYLLWLSEGYLLDQKNKDRYLEAFERIVTDWLVKNPPGFGVNWLVSMEVAIRGCNLALATSVFSRDIRPSLFREIIVSLNEHRAFIDRFPEFSDVQGNHFLSNLMGLAVLDSCLFGSCSVLAKKSRQRFFEEADAQFELDGCQIERAPIYHRLCLDMVALVLMFDLRANNVSQSGVEVLKRGVKFAREVSSSRGLLPVFGDADSGHILWFKECSRDFEGLFELAKYFDTDEEYSLTINSNTIWLSVISGKYLFSTDACQSPYRQTRTSDKSGYCAIHDGEIDAVMKVGPQGLKGRASHDHDDALSVWVFLKGQDFIVERGCFAYTLCSEERAKDIGSLSHNLVQPKGRNRSNSSRGSIVQTAKGAQTASDWFVSGQGTSPSIYAKMKKNSNVESIFEFHSRSVSCVGEKKKILTVADEWAWSDEPDAAELRWHFAPGLRLAVPQDVSNKVLVRMSNGKVISTMEFESCSNFRIEKFAFSFSERYGQQIKSTGLKIIVNCHSRSNLVTKFQFS